MAASISHDPPSVTPLAMPLTLTGVRALGDEAAAERLHPLYRSGLARVPRGRLVSRGLPFDPPGRRGGAPGAAHEGTAGAGPEEARDGDPERWVLLDEPAHIELGGTEATWLVLLHFCDAWTDEHGERPPGTPVGWVIPVGEPLVAAQVRRRDGSVIETTFRRRFEVNEGLIGWGAMAFLALPHLVEQPVDWRGPHARLGTGRVATAGHAGPLGILPGSWAGAQTGVTDVVPSATDELMLWLHALDVRGVDGRPSALESIDVAPLPGEGRGRTVVLAAITAFTGTASPLRWRPRRALRLSGARTQPVAVDLGLLARRIPLGSAGRDGAVMGWGADGRDADGGDRGGGSARDESAPGDELIELTAADDAIIRVGARSVPLREVSLEAGAVTAGPARVVALAPADRRLAVAVRDHHGRPVASRVRIMARDGRALAPEGHRLEVNPAIGEDFGGDVVLRGAQYAYVPADFRVDVPADGATLEVVRGFETGPQRLVIDRDDLARQRVDVRLDDPIDIDGGREWVNGDTHVHFLAPSTALLQAEAEGVNVVHLLATQWGDHHTGTTDLRDDLVDATGRHAVWMGSENRQNLLGHIGIVGTPRPLFPFASGGPPEGPIGGPVTHLMADWLAACRRQGGLAIGAHFPLPMAEIAADIDAGLLDALEVQCFDETLQSPPIREWYRYLDAGYRLPLVGGTDKMSAGIPLGQVRTYARLAPGAALTFEAWAAAVRAGRTFVTSGPLLELRVEGRSPGDELRLGGESSVEVELRARSAQPVIEALEIVLDGRVEARVDAASGPVSELLLRERIAVARSGWVAGRSRSSVAIGSAFASAMAAHTSPVYLGVAGRPQPAADIRVPLALVDGTRAWLETLAPVRDTAEAARFRRFLDEAERRLRERGV